MKNYLRFPVRPWGLCLGWWFAICAALTLAVWCVTPPSGLDALLMPTRSERSFHEKWLTLNGRIEPLLFGRGELQDWRWSGHRFHRKVDGSALLILPRDLRLLEVPVVVKDLEEELWGSETPSFATSRRLTALLEITEASLQVRGADTWFLPRWLLERRRSRIWEIRYRTGNCHDLFELEGVPPGQRLARLRELLPKVALDSEDRRIVQDFLQIVSAHPDWAEERLVPELREALSLAVFQVAAHRMARGMTTFTRAEFRHFQEAGQIKAGSKRKEADYPEAGRSLWAVLDMDGRARELALARQTVDAARIQAMEESALRAIQAQVHRYPWSDLGWGGMTATPDEIVKTKAMNCVGMSLLMHALLQSLGIDHQAVDLPSHIAMAVNTTGGGDWLADATGGAEPIPLKGELPRDTPAFLRPGVLARDCPDNLAHRHSAERGLAVAMLDNYGSQAIPPSGGVHGEAWNPFHLVICEKGYDTALRGGRTLEAAVRLDKLKRLLADEPEVWVDVWALELELGRKKNAASAWKRAMEKATTRAQRALQQGAADEVWVTPENTGDFADLELEAAVTALDESGIQWVLQAVDKKTLTLALFAAGSATRRAFYDQMSSRAVALMEEEIREMLKEVEPVQLRAAQSELRDVLNQEMARDCDIPHSEEAGVAPQSAEEAPARHRITLPGGRLLDVCGLPEALKTYLGYDAVISLQDPWAEVEWGYHPRHWIFRVRDIEGEDEYAPSLELVRQILALDLGQSLDILVHCHEGFSRSTATAILLATQLGAIREAILDGIDWTHAYPNLRILGYGEELLGTGGRLTELVEEGLKRGGWR